MTRNELDTKILGVDKTIIEEFLLLIRDKYPLADMANYFLETHFKTAGINVATTNQRDVLSHLCTILSNPDLDKKKQIGQISAAEEHLRRAIIESYQIAVELKVGSIGKLAPDYRAKVLPFKDEISDLNDCLTWEQVKEILAEIECLRTVGRNAKSRNRWDSEWEKGVAAYLDAFIKADDLASKLDNSLLMVQHRFKSKLHYVAYASIALNVLAIMFLLYKLF